jgi:Tol biopolymer transport system component
MRLTLGCLAAMALLSSVAVLPANAKAHPNGQITFTRFDPLLGGPVPYTINPDGTHEQRVVEGVLGGPQFSPDGGQIAGCCTDTAGGHSAATILDPDSHSVVRVLPEPDPDVDAYCGRWSPDGARLACESFGTSDPALSGIYTIRSSDGGGLRRVTSDPGDQYGGDDHPGDFSPDGARLAFVRYSSTCLGCVYVINVNGTGMHRVTPPGFGVVSSDPSWSPRGNTLVFSARATPDVHSTLWTVHSDGSDLHQIDVPVPPGMFPCGAPNSDPTAGGCFGPSWSPDGKKIVFERGDDGIGIDVFTVDASGSHLFQVTHGEAGESNEGGDWGTHPLA